MDVSYCVKNVHSLVDWQKDHHSKIPSKLGTGQQTAMRKWFAHGLYRGLGMCWVLVWMQLLFWQFEYRFKEHALNSESLYRDCPLTCAVEVTMFLG